MGAQPSFFGVGRGLQWKLTLSYTAVTVGALLTIELILLASVGVLVLTLVNSGFLPTLLIETASVSYTPILRAYLSQTPPDRDGLSVWLENVENTSVTLPLDFDASDRLFIISSDGTLLAARPADLLGQDQIGRPVNPEAITGLAEPLEAALSGEEDLEKLYTLTEPDAQVVLTVPIWDVGHQRVLGVLAGVADRPTFASILGDILPVLLLSLLILTLVAGLAGALYGYLAARGPVRRLEVLAGATQAWSQGDFSEMVDDPAEDELGELARRLNDMARELERLMETRRELAVLEERNRLARELHDSAKQQAFAAAAQISGVRSLISREPAVAEEHIAEAERIVHRLRQELTSLILELRPAGLEDRGLIQALREYTSEWSKQNGILSELRIQGERSLPFDMERSLFRIVQEALANVARHSQADSAKITLSYNSDHVTLCVSDDGRGIDLGRQTAGFGLRSMTQRAESTGGSLDIKSEPGKGTAISCTMPIPGLKSDVREERNG